MLKKFLIVGAAAFCVGLAAASIAMAYGGIHGGFSTTTDACAGCHRAHTAPLPRLLIDDENILCLACHGTTGAGANTNVVDGVFLNRLASSNGYGTLNAPLIAGGFTSYKGVTSTSSHDTSGGVAAAWGISGTNRGVAGAMSDGGMTCTSCHNPHGSINYRILNTRINGLTIAVTQTDDVGAPAGFAKDYTQEHWSADASTACDGCHATYHITTTGSGSNITVSLSGGYTHRVDRTTSKGGTNVVATTGWSKGDGITVTLPFASRYLTSTLQTNDTLIVCQTCHLAHGSSSQMTGAADGGPDLSGPPGDTLAGDSALLRLDNRGVCEACHQK